MKVSDMARDIKVNMKHKLKAENLISAFCLYFLVGDKGGRGSAKSPLAISEDAPQDVLKPNTVRLQSRLHRLRVKNFSFVLTNIPAYAIIHRHLRV